MTVRRWHVGVVIPARNEEALLPRCLRSVLIAKGQLTGRATVDIVVIADSSTDRTMEIAADMLHCGHEHSDGIVMGTMAGSVGAARQAATHRTLERYPGPLHRCWIASTDADCIVPPHWLQQQLDFAEQNIQALAGTISVDHFEEHGPEVPSRFRSSYLIEADGSHPHVHGANLGFRADAYVRAGGWSQLATAEDHDLWRRLAKTGARQHSTSHLEVKTSGRRIGRAPNGFAGALAAHNENAA